MLRDTNKFEDIVDDLQAAAFDPALWPRVLEKISRYAEGAGAVLFSMDQRFKAPPSSPDLEAMLEEYFISGWFAQDSRYLGLPEMKKKGVINDFDCMSADEMARSDFYRGFLEKHRRKWFAGIGFFAGDELWCLSLQRSSDKGAFQEADLAQLRTLWRPFNDSATLSRSLGEAWLDGMVHSFEAVGTAALICDDRGRVLDISEPALAELKPYLLGNQLTFPLSADADAFSNMMRSALNPAPSLDVHPLSCRLRLGRHHATLRAIPLHRQGRLVFSKASVLLLVTREHETPDAALRRVYRLTDAEIRVAIALASGIDIPTMAHAFKTKPDTLRAQLKAAYAKTGAKGQAQLVALIGDLKAGVVGFDHPSSIRRNPIG